jgi:hypothetical protein
MPAFVPAGFLAKGQAVRPGQFENHRIENTLPDGTRRSTEFALESDTHRISRRVVLPRVVSYKAMFLSDNAAFGFSLLSHTLKFAQYSRCG